VAVDLGPAAGCEAPAGVVGSVDVWAWDVGQSAAEQLTTTGNAYVASFWPTVSGTRGFPLYISHAASEPWSEFVSLYGVLYDQEPVRGVFLPLMAPDGNRALFWSGTMASSGDGWQFSLGGMPQLSGDFRSTGPASPWIGTPLFTDLVPVGGEAFAYGNFAWADDSATVAFWNGAWTGAPEGGEGYPNQTDVYYVGSIYDGLLSIAARFGPALGDGPRVVDLTFHPGGGVAVTVAFPSAGIGDPPSAKIQVNIGEPYVIGGGIDPPPWDGPAVYGR
jgi:hypothetical protein